MYDAIQTIKEAADDIAKDLAGFSTRAAIQKLAENWEDAVVEGNPQFTKMSMAQDIDEVIANLTRLKLGLAPGEDATRRMRKELGLDYELPPFETIPTESWLKRVSALYPDFTPDGIAGVAEQEYHLHRGVLPSEPMTAYRG